MRILCFAVGLAASSDPYSVLGLNNAATPTEIDLAYRNLALEWHPHLNADISTATEKFREVGEAYSTIKGNPKAEPMDMFREFFETGDPFAAMHNKDPLHAEELKEEAPPQSLGRRLQEEPRPKPRSRPPIKPHQMTPHEFEVPKPAVPYPGERKPGQMASAHPSGKPKKVQAQGRAARARPTGRRLRDEEF
jgi:curved DNA-binding protein CbpA